MPRFLLFIVVTAMFMAVTGFSVDNAIVPQEEILSGGPPKDGIPALLTPTFISAGQADYLNDDDQVIGVAVGGHARAYPLKILNWHEAVNDTVAGQPLVVTFWPLTQSGVVYSRKVNGKQLTFGISGRLYKSNVLLYDHQSESLWSQLMSKAISGPMVRQTLSTLPAVRLSWKKWRHLHPDTQVLSERTGYNRNYRIDPYEGYYRVGRLMFPVGSVRRDLSTKERVLGIVVDGKAKAYVLERLLQHTGIFKDRIGDVAITIEVSDAGEVVSVQDASGQPLVHIYLYWFAWQAFYPHTTVHHF